jgi:hypothetical protein
MSPGIAARSRLQARRPCREVTFGPLTRCPLRARMWRLQKEEVVMIRQHLPYFDDDAPKEPNHNTRTGH